MTTPSAHPTGTGAVRPPSAPTGLTANAGSAGITCALPWQPVNYPSSGVYYTVHT